MDKRYEVALSAAMADLTRDPEVVGILFTGSVQQGHPEPSSDMDLYVLTHKSYTWRATRLYAGVKTELFFNNPASMRWRITRPDEIAAAAGFATGNILLDRTGEMAELQALARKRWEAGPPAPSPEEVSRFRYELDDLCEDLEDVQGDPVAAKLMGHQVVFRSLQIFCRLHRYWGAKPKRLAAYVTDRDPTLGAMLAECYTDGMAASKALAIVDYVLAPVGGRLKLWESEKVEYPGGDQR